jgi:hypothetical protein
MVTASTTPMTELDELLLNALKSLGGKATLGDLVQKTTLPLYEVEGRILKALSHVGGHIAVDDHGNLVYSIERTRPLPSFVPSWPKRIALWLYAAFKATFFAALSIALVMYFAVYVIIILAAMVAAIAAAAKGNDCDCDCDCKGADCGKCGCDGCVVCCDGDVCRGFNRAGDNIYGKVVAKRRPERLEERKEVRKVQEAERVARLERKRARTKERAERLHNAVARLGNRRGKNLDMPLEAEVVTETPPFLRAVRDFVFGPVRTAPSANTEYQNLLGFARDHEGRITAMDAVLLTGLPLDAADRMLLQLAAQLEGNVEVGDDGVVVYTFDRVMVSVGSDLDVTPWLAAQGGQPVSVQRFAEQFSLDPTDAQARLEVLADLAQARVDQRDRTLYTFDAAALERLAEAGRAHESLRSFDFAWERLEKAPAIIGVPPGKRGWIYGLNTLNLFMSLLLAGYYDDGERLVGPAIGLMSETFELYALAIVPFCLSLGVFVIPLVRAIVIAFGNSGRKRRNVRRLMLLALAHALLDDEVISAAELRRNLKLDTVAEPAIERQLTKLGAELEAGLTSNGELSFARAHRELRAVAVASDVRRGTFSLKQIVYDTSKPM